MRNFEYPLSYEINQIKNNLRQPYSLNEIKNYIKTLLQALGELQHQGIYKRNISPKTLGVA